MYYLQLYVELHYSENVLVVLWWKPQSRSRKLYNMQFSVQAPVPPMVQSIPV